MRQDEISQNSERIQLAGVGAPVSVMGEGRWSVNLMTDGTVTMRILLGGIEQSDLEVMHALPADSAVAHAATVDELLECVYACSPDILVVSEEMPEVWEGVQRISAVLPAPVILVAAQEGKLAETRLATTDIFGYLVRPINAATLHQAMLVAVVQFQRFYGARAEADALREAFASRKIIDRAKGIIMQRRRLSENEAYAFLREESRRLRTPIVEIARSLLNEADPSVGAGKAGHLSSAPSTGRGVGTVTSPASRVLRSA